MEEARRVAHSARRLLTPLLLGLLLPHLLLRLPAVLREGWSALLIPSLEALLLAAILVLLARVWPGRRRIVPPIAAVLAEFLFE
jgi:hypothetical protein